MLNLLLIVAALMGLPTLSQAGRVLMSIVVKLIGLAFLMSIAIIVLMAVVTHGKVV